MWCNSALQMGSWPLPAPCQLSYNSADPPWPCRRRRPGASCPALPPSSGTASLPSTPLPPAPSSVLLLRPTIRRPRCSPASPGGVTGSTPLAVADGCSGGAAAAARHARDAGWGGMGVISGLTELLIGRRLSICQCAPCHEANEWAPRMLVLAPTQSQSAHPTQHRQNLQKVPRLTVLRRQCHLQRRGRAGHGKCRVDCSKRGGCMQRGHPWAGKVQFSSNNKARRSARTSVQPLAQASCPSKQAAQAHYTSGQQVHACSITHVSAP